MLLRLGKVKNDCYVVREHTANHYILFFLQTMTHTHTLLSLKEFPDKNHSLDLRQVHLILDTANYLLLVYHADHLMFSKWLLYLKTVKLS